MIPNLAPVDTIGLVNQSIGGLASAPSSRAGFEPSVLQFITDTDRAISAANDAVTSFAVGDAIPPHQVMLSLEQARLKLQFALQVRTQLLEGFQELMRTQL